MTWKAFFIVFPLLVWALLYVFAVRPIALGRRAAFLVQALLFCSAAKFGCFLVFGGNTFNPEFPQHLIMVWNFFDAVMMLFAGFVAPTVVFDGVFRRCAGRNVSVGTKRIRAALLLVLSVGVAVWGLWESARVPRIVEREALLPDLPPAFEGYRIAHLSDLHCSSSARRARFEAIVRATNAAKPNLVAITGDFVDGVPERRARDLEPLSGLSAPDGVFGSTGNHEGYWPYVEWAPYLAKWNVRILADDCVVIRRGADAIAVGGAHDSRLFKGKHALKRGDHTNLFRKAPDRAFRIFLYHEPLLKHKPYTADFVKADLMLSGHTHGGALPGLHLVVARHNEGHLRGFYREGRTLIHVSPGTGQWAGFPLRLFNPAEITVLVLRRGKPE